MTRLLRGASWSPAATLTATGDNRLTKIAFEYDGRHVASDLQVRGFLQMGSSNAAGSTDDVTVSECAFAYEHFGIAATSRPVRRMVLTGNELGGHGGALYFGGWNITVPAFDISDSVITGNRFVPGAFNSNLPSQLGASTRLDFSDNIADGKDVSRLAASDVMRTTCKGPPSVGTILGESVLASDQASSRLCRIVCLLLNPRAGAPSCASGAPHSHTGQIPIVSVTQEA